jgi:hypothetical protein
VRKPAVSAADNRVLATECQASILDPLPLLLLRNSSQPDTAVGQHDVKPVILENPAANFALARTPIAVGDRRAVEALSPQSGRWQRLRSG